MTSALALHAVDLDERLQHEEAGNNIDAAVAPPSPEQLTFK